MRSDAAGSAQILYERFPADVTGNIRLKGSEEYMRSPRSAFKTL